MEKIISPILLTVISIVIFSCSSPMNKKYKEENLAHDILAMNEKLDTTEIQLLAGTIFRLKFKNEKIDNLTYAEILEKGKIWVAKQAKIEEEQRALALKIKKEEQERMSSLSEAVGVSCLKKSLSKYEYQEYIIYKFLIQNKSDKDIRAIKGRIVFSNLFDDEINSLSFVYDQPIKAGKDVRWNAQTDYNKFMNKDVALKNKDLKDIKVVWKPEKIIFVDASILE